MFAHKAAQPLIELQEKLRAAVGKPKRAFEPPVTDAAIAERVQGSRQRQASRRRWQIKDKKQRATRRSTPPAARCSSALTAECRRERGSPRRSRPRSRAQEEVRCASTCSSTAQAHRRPRPRRDPPDHDRGRHPAARARLGAVHPRRDAGAGRRRRSAPSTTSRSSTRSSATSKKTLLLHYNFPPFSTGESSRCAAPVRREIGHGALAERAIARVMPGRTRTSRTRSASSREILESNGSSSMASVCGGSLALMDAGVPIKAPVAGIAMGLIEGGRRRTSSCPTSSATRITSATWTSRSPAPRRGITAIQMDIKIDGLTREILEEALEQAREGRIHILDKMDEALSAPRDELSQVRAAHHHGAGQARPDPRHHRPRRQDDPRIIEQTGVAIDVEDDGTVSIASRDAQSGRRRRIDIITGLTTEPEVGAVLQRRRASASSSSARSSRSCRAPTASSTSARSRRSASRASRTCSRRATRSMVKVHQGRPRRQDPPVAPRGDGQVARRRPQLPRRRVLASDEARGS